MGSGKGNTSFEMVKRAVRTVIFMVIMFFSFVVSSGPLLVSLVDVFTPCILLSTFLHCNSCLILNHNWAAYSFRTSLIDIPLLSLMRSLTIFGVYSVCGVPRLTYGLYVLVTTLCGLLSAALLSFKAYVFIDGGIFNHNHPLSPQTKHQSLGIILLLSSSMVLALAHVLIACRVRFLAQKKMHLYRLDPEMLSGLNRFIYTSIHDRYRRVNSDGSWDDNPMQSLTLHFIPSDPSLL